LEVSGTYVVSSDARKNWVDINAQIKVPRVEDRSEFTIAFLFPTFGRKEEKTEIVTIKKKSTEKWARSWEKYSSQVSSSKKTARDIVYGSLPYKMKKSKSWKQMHLEFKEGVIYLRISRTFKSKKHQ
jgi:hypothetical protein